MKNIVLLHLLLAIAFSSLGQNIKLSQTKSATDIKVITAPYNIYFKKSDVIAAIPLVTATMETSYAGLLDSIKKNLIKTINLDLKKPGDKTKRELINSGLGLYLLTRGKATIYQGARQVKVIVPDEAPMIEDMDGKRSAIMMQIQEPKSGKVIFVGEINRSLRN